MSTRPTGTCVQFDEFEHMYSPFVSPQSSNERGYHLQESPLHHVLPEKTESCPTLEAFIFPKLAFPLTHFPCPPSILHAQAH